MRWLVVRDSINYDHIKIGPIDISDTNLLFKMFFLDISILFDNVNI